MTRIIEAILLIGLVAGLPGLLFLLVRNIEYRLSRHEVEVLLFRLVIRKIHLQDISDVKVGLRLPCELWPSVRLFQGRFLSIRRKRGFWLPFMVITPRDPETFRRNLCFALNWKP